MKPYKQRCQIYALNNSGMSQTAIADTLGVTQPTISREHRRNSGERGYRFKQASPSQSVLMTNHRRR